MTNKQHISFLSVRYVKQVLWNWELKHENMCVFLENNGGGLGVCFLVLSMVSHLGLYRLPLSHKKKRFVCLFV